jgi:hypothetical protein
LSSLIDPYKFRLISCDGLLTVVERVRVTVRVRPPMTLLERKEEAAPFIFLDTDKNTLILRRKYAHSARNLIPPPPCMHVILDSGFFFPQFCDVFVAVATIHKRKEPNLVTGQIEVGSKQFLQSCCDVFATFKKSQVSRLLPCFPPYQNMAN